MRTANPPICRTKKIAQNQAAPKRPWRVFIWYPSQRTASECRRRAKNSLSALPRNLRNERNAFQESEARFQRSADTALIGDATRVPLLIRTERFGPFRSTLSKESASPTRLRDFAESFHRDLRRACQR